MGRALELKAPIFEIGFKAYLYGQKAVELAIAADRISAAYEIPIILSPQYVDIARIADATENLFVFAQHCDAVGIGEGAGSVLPEALKAAGAAGVMLNHAEKRMTLSDISRTIKRAAEAGLYTMVCSDTPEEAMAVAQLHPNVILTEPPELIGSGDWVAQKGKAVYIADSVNMVKNIDPRIAVLSGAGLKSGKDAGQIISMGADGTGSCTGIVKAADPAGMIEEMVSALMEAWKARSCNEIGIYLQQTLQKG